MRKGISGLALVLVVSVISLALADGEHDRRGHRVRLYLSGFNEVHFAAGPPAALRGAVSTAARGKFAATIDHKGESIDYELSYQGLEGAVTQVHIHFGQRHTVGGIVVWLCQTATTPAPPAVVDDTPFCPAEGTVTGTITPAQVLAQTAQGIEAGEFDEFVRAMKAGAAYVNVHSALFPPGEIRGQFPDDVHD